LTINSELEADTRSSRLQAFGFQRENRVALGWKLAAGNWKLHATAPCALLVRLRPPSRLTALRRDFGEQCFCGRKNYRLQDIQLSKIDPVRGNNPSEFGHPRDCSPGPPRLTHSRGPMPRSDRSPELLILRSTLAAMQARRRELELLRAAFGRLRAFGASSSQAA